MFYFVSSVLFVFCFYFVRVFCAFVFCIWWFLFCEHFVYSVDICGYSVCFCVDVFRGYSVCFCLVLICVYFCLCFVCIFVRFWVYFVRVLYQLCISVNVYSRAISVYFCVFVGLCRILCIFGIFFNVFCLFFAFSRGKGGERGGKDVSVFFRAFYCK